VYPPSPTHMVELADQISKANRPRLAVAKLLLVAEKRRLCQFALELPLSRHMQRSETLLDQYAGTTGGYWSSSTFRWAEADMEPSLTGVAKHRCHCAH